MNTNTGAYTMSMPSRLIHELQAVKPNITFPIQCSLILTIDPDGQPRYSLTNITSVPAPIKKPKEEYHLSLPPGYSAMGRGTPQRADDHSRRCGPHIFDSREEAERAGYGDRWDEGHD
jgi:hypothetical protein